MLGEIVRGPVGVDDSLNVFRKYYKCAGPNLVDPSPQRTPFILQAGGSKAGMAFAAKHTEAMFLPGMTPEKTAPVVQTVRGLLRDLGRPEDSIKFIAGIYICVDETDERAQAKFEDYLQYSDLDGTASLFGGWTGSDLSKFSDDEDFAFVGPPAIQGLINTWSATVNGTKDVKWTKRRVLQELAICGAHGRAIGSAKTVADILERWVDVAGVDGFNLSYAVTPESHKDLITHLWPELHHRGVLQTEYAGQSMRQNYIQDGGGPRVRAGHPATEYHK